MNLKSLGSLIWPENKGLFLTGGAVIGLLADLMSFLGNLGSPLVLLMGAIVVALVVGAVCLPKLKPAAGEGGDTEEGAECLECGIFRLALFSIVALGVLMLAGQGVSATERIGSQLGLIQRDVAAVREDVSAIRDVTADSEIIRNPRTAAERYRNAWLYANHRRDTDNAWSQLQALYADFTPNKLDAAELYFTTGLTKLARPELIAQMLETGRAKRDAAMLVVVARNMTTHAEAAPIIAEARAFDAEMPFTYWDPQVPRVLNDGTAQHRYETALAEIAAYEAFLAAVEKRRPSDYYFMPQYQADWEAQARERLHREQARLPNLAERAARQRR